MYQRSIFFRDMQAEVKWTFFEDVYYLGSHHWFKLYIGNVCEYFAKLFCQQFSPLKNSIHNDEIFDQNAVFKVIQMCLLYTFISLVNK